MIEMLGVGVADGSGGWWLHRVCARLRRGQLVAVVSSLPQEREALLDSVSGRTVPIEGRMWVEGVPVMRTALGRVRALVGDVRPEAPVSAGRSVLWNTLVAAGARRSALPGVLRFPRHAERQAALQAVEALGLQARKDDPVAELDDASRLRLALARALAARPEVLIVRDPDLQVRVGEAAAILERLRALTGAERLLVLTSLASMALATEYADRLVVISEGALIYEGPPGGLSEARAPRLDAFILSDR
jgi:ABC-type phosphate/phosphonate transport system ATPase subunit